MREEARRARDQSGAPKNRDDYTQTFGGKGSSVPRAVLTLHLVQILGHLGKGTMNNGILGHPMYLMERMMFHDLTESSAKVQTHAEAETACTAKRMVCHASS